MSLAVNAGMPLAPGVCRLAEAARANVAPLEVLPLTARHRPAWDAFLHAHPAGTFFHTIAWMESVAEVFGHQPHYLFARRGSRIAGVLPLFEVRSLFGGRMLVSVPYAVAGGVLATDDAARDALWHSALGIAADVGARTIELRSESPQIDGLTGVSGYVVFRRELPDCVGDVPGFLPRKARAAARQARDRHGLTVEFGDHYLPAVWRLYVRSMRRLGSLCYPQRFFEALHERCRRDTFVQVVRSQNRIVAGLISFRFGAAFLPYFAGCDERFQRTNANNFLYLTAMERAVAEGCRVFDFGRTRRDNRGPYDFKRFHGFEPQPLGYQRYVVHGGAAPNLSPSNPRFRLARRVWRRLPTPIVVRLGTWAARHIPG